MPGPLERGKSSGPQCLSGATGSCPCFSLYLVDFLACLQMHEFLPVAGKGFSPPLFYHIYISEKGDWDWLLV